VAGRFYPADPAKLRRVVETAVAEARREARAGSPPKALVAPHAGYVYSGHVAASAYAQALPLRGQIHRVVLVGPAHWGARAGVVVPSADAFATPLGPVRVDTEARDRLAGSGRVAVDDAAHAREHSLEVHLPFLQVVLGEVAVLPLAVSEAAPAEVADVLDDVWGGPETLVVVSTDLSHYHDQATATALDRSTAAAVVARQPEAIAPDRACGAVPLQALLLAARHRGLEVELLDLCTSADTVGQPDRVVGYGAFALA
jgi:AmmeMemoRadiSam system protein B